MKHIDANLWQVDVCIVCVSVKKSSSASIPTNTCVFHVETTWKRPLIRHFNVEFRCYIRRDGCNGSVCDFVVSTWKILFHILRVHVR